MKKITNLSWLITGLFLMGMIGCAPIKPEIKSTAPVPTATAVLTIAPSPEPTAAIPSPTVERPAPSAAATYPLEEKQPALSVRKKPRPTSIATSTSLPSTSAVYPTQKLGAAQPQKVPAKVEPSPETVEDLAGRVAEEEPAISEWTPTPITAWLGPTEVSPIAQKAGSFPWAAVILLGLGIGIFLVYFFIRRRAKSKSADQLVSKKAPHKIEPVVASHPTRAHPEEHVTPHPPAEEKIAPESKPSRQAEFPLLEPIRLHPEKAAEVPKVQVTAAKAKREEKQKTAKRKTAKKITSRRTLLSKPSRKRGKAKAGRTGQESKIISLAKRKARGRRRKASLSQEEVAKKIIPFERRKAS